ncbi:MAG: 6-phosphogluconolactonase [Verrucomicrobiota bacterium]|nr:6-phosphogluconolactonase [Verrucomicrobiota bacterium]
MAIRSWDERRDLLIAATYAEAVHLAAEHWFHSAERALQRRGRFAVAFSGGSTPKAVYHEIAKSPNRISWDSLSFFWSDERAVPPTDPESNYCMTMKELSLLPIPKGQIFRMEAEENIEKKAKEYEEKILHFLGKDLFDLVLLGVGEDGHTASLFPNTAVLEEKRKLVAAAYVPQKNSWRMTLTFPCIEKSAHTVFYAFGSAKKEIVKKVLTAPIISSYPASRVGTPEAKALWILDKEAASLLT